MVLSLGRSEADVADHSLTEHHGRPPQVKSPEDPLIQTELKISSIPVQLKISSTQSGREDLWHSSGIEDLRRSSRQRSSPRSSRTEGYSGTLAGHRRVLALQPDLEALQSSNWTLSHSDLVRTGLILSGLWQRAEKILSSHRRALACSSTSASNID
ncbi:hypothetical protein Nepgr_027825 [Nepenthes gracilis]|uniref:Uncharacterized protein n=1 Tax=Nepenthes gracilis TaxID=150966 RepID=A0AAD3TCF4_NEPGR|nr:hypothetical protein Nepgr_027825 [Nepenthes gracilis]